VVALLQHLPPLHENRNACEFTLTLTAIRAYLSNASFPVTGTLIFVHLRPPRDGDGEQSPPAIGMFGLHHDAASQLNAIDNPSLLYNTSEELLGSALLTPDPDPKFDISGTKADDAPFGAFDTLGIYTQYDESGPSSVQFGDGIEPSEHGGSHLSIKDDLLGATATSNGGHARANGAGQPLLVRSNNNYSSPQHQNGTGDNLFGRREAMKDIPSPLRDQVVDISTPANQNAPYDHIEVKS
jgi:hypothetical protein